MFDLLQTCSMVQAERVRAGQVLRRISTVAVLLAATFATPATSAAAAPQHVAMHITTGETNSCAVLTTGAVRCWGYNEFGQLGDGTTKNQFLPITVNGVNNPKQFTAGWGHMCA